MTLTGGRRCPAPLRRSCGWSQRAGTPKRRPPARASAPPSSFHVDIQTRLAALHLGSRSARADRRYLTCDATCEVWFSRDGQVIGAGRSTRTVQPAAAPGARASRPGVCGARLRGARALQAHHLVHWRTRPHRTVEPGSAGVSVSPSGPSPGPDHDHRPRRPARRHRRRRPRPDLSLVGRTTTQPRPTSPHAPARPGNARTGGGTSPTTPPSLDELGDDDHSLCVSESVKAAFAAPLRRLPSKPYSTASPRMARNGSSKSGSSPSPRRPPGIR